MNTERFGLRTMMSETRISEDSTTVIQTPATLLPLESDLLAGLDYLTEHDERQPEITPFSLAHQIYPEDGSQLLYSGAVYKALQRLERWGYIESDKRISVIGNGSRDVLKTFCRVSIWGKARLRRDARWAEDLIVKVDTI